MSTQAASGRAVAPPPIPAKKPSTRPSYEEADSKQQYEPSSSANTTFGPNMTANRPRRASDSDEHPTIVEINELQKTNPSAYEARVPDAYRGAFESRLKELSAFAGKQQATSADDAQFAKAPRGNKQMYMAEPSFSSAIGGINRFSHMNIESRTGSAPNSAQSSPRSMASSHNEFSSNLTKDGKPTLTLEQLQAVLAVAQATKESGQVQVQVDAQPSMLDTIVPVSKKKERFARRWHNRVVFFAATLVMLYICEEWIRNVVTKTLSDSYYPRYGLLAFLPFIMFFMIFGINTVLICIMSLFGPVSHICHNSPYYSVYPPDTDVKPEVLPTVTVQIPIYKESFTETIKPTLESVHKAVLEYNKHGGQVNVYINDDGLMLITPEQQQERIDYYNQFNIGYCARPPHEKVERRGRFKKASNMNYSLTVAHRVDEEVKKLKAGESIKYQVDPTWEESELRGAIVSQMGQEEGFMAGNNVKMGDYVLLLDSDSRIPVDCMLPVVMELEESPNIAFTQHLTQPMQIVHDYWENAISHFTNRIYENAIVMSCSGGDVAPLMGHNAFLRWEALQKASFVADYDGQRKYWSEAHVSEDFDLAIRSYHAGYGGRYVAYGQGFEEGVSLCVRDEITRFQKYAFGASEVLFNPISQWCRKGISGEVIRKFFAAKNLPTTAKYNILGYLGTYFAMACAPILVLANYFLYAFSTVWRNDTISGEIWLVIMIVFGILSPISNVIFAYRTGRKGLGFELVKEFMYAIQLTIFFNGLCYHIMTATLAHLFGYNMQWGATAKEITLTNFFKEFKTTFSLYKKMYIIDILVAGMMCAFAFAVPSDYVITSFPAIFPLALMVAAHFMMPFLLNPVMMRVRF